MLCLGRWHIQGSGGRHMLIVLRIGVLGGPRKSRCLALVRVGVLIVCTTHARTHIIIGKRGAVVFEEVVFSGDQQGLV